MTDNEIIKALECCIKDDYDKGCSECPVHCYNGCDFQLAKFALDLIKRQQAEIERLSKPQGVIFLANGIEIHVKDSDEYYKFKRLVKAEAITEFAERLKEKYGVLDVVVTLDDTDIDNLVEEMTEGDNGYTS